MLEIVRRTVHSMISAGGVSHMVSTEPMEWFGSEQRNYI